MLKPLAARFILPALLAIFMLAACGGSVKDRNISETPQRNGSSLSLITAKYNDFAPQLSSDGTKVIFRSGRDSTDTQLSRKTYKVDWAAGGTPAAPARVTSEDLGLEEAAALSPDGTWVAIVGVLAGKTSLHLKDYAGTKAALEIPDTAAVKASPSFSPNDDLLAWISYDDAGVGTVKIVTIGTGAAADLATIVAVTTEDSVYDFFWIPTEDADPLYALAIGTRATGKAAVTYTVRRFATAAAAATAQATELATDILPTKEGAQPVATRDKAFIPTDVLGYAARQVSQVGDVVATPEAPLPLVNLDSEALAVTVADGVSSAMTEQPGFQVLSLSAGTSAGFAAMRFRYGCQSGAADYGSGIVIAPTDGGAATILVPKLTAVAAVEAQPDQLTFDVADGFCDNLKVEGDSAGGTHRLDDRITTVAVNRAATATTYRLTYVTNFSHRFNVDCTLRAGDQEVMVLDVNGATRTIHTLSANRAPLTNAEGADCAL